MFVGLGGAGKTTLLTAMRTKQTTGSMAPVTITDGIDIAEWTVKTNLDNTLYGKDVTINYAMWDFAGQSVYYNTHQVPALKS